MIDMWGSNHFIFILISMAHRDIFIGERVIVDFVAKRLFCISVEDGWNNGLESTAKAWLQKRPLCCPPHDAAFVAGAHRNLITSARDRKAATSNPRRKSAVISSFVDAGLRARHAAVKDLLAEERLSSTVKHLQGAVFIASRVVTFCNVHLARQIVGRF
jgi:hypothetical protein